MSAECGQRVAVTRGEHVASDDTPIGRGELAWVIGHQGDAAILAFEGPHGTRYATVPEADLRALTSYVPPSDTERTGVRL